MVPDVVWLSTSRLAAAIGEDGKLHAPPELVIEVLCPGAVNARRDREAKLKLYSRKGVAEYWILDWISRVIGVYELDDGELKLVRNLGEDDVLESTLLPGFSARVGEFFQGIPM